MDDVDVFPREAAAVAMKAIEQGIAGITNLTYEQEYKYAKALIERARGMVQDAMATGYIAMPKDSQAPKPTKATLKAVAKLTAKKPAKPKKPIAKKKAPAKKVAAKRKAHK
jgi:hypothetical protein